MPSILVRGSKESWWTDITDYHISKDGYLMFFRVELKDGSVADLHLIRNNVVGHIPLLAASLFTGATNLRSARGLLADFEKLANRLKWYDAEKFPNFATHAKNVGSIIGSAILLQKFIESRPFRKEGYYDSEENMYFDKAIKITDTANYRP